MMLCISLSSANLEGIGTPFSPLCPSKVDVAKPNPPLIIDSFTIACISNISESVAFLVKASSPIT